MTRALACKAEGRQRKTQKLVMTHRQQKTERSRKTVNTNNENEYTRERPAHASFSAQNIAAACDLERKTDEKFLRSIFSSARLVGMDKLNARGF